jgi:hypothetical protein
VALIAAAPYMIHTVLTDYGIQFHFPPSYADGGTATVMTHMFDKRRRENAHPAPLQQNQPPWTSGQVERMNRTINQAAVQPIRRPSAAQRPSR